MELFLEWCFVLFALLSSIIPLVAKRLVGAKYGEYAAWGTIFLTSAIIATISYGWFHVDFITGFVRAIILIALPYGSSLHWIDRRLLSPQPKQAGANGESK